VHSLHFTPVKKNKPRKTQKPTLSTPVDQDLYDRADKVARCDRRYRANVVRLCLENYLPVLEKELGITPPPQTGGAEGGK
jgi:hypothetical protein